MRLAVVGQRLLVGTRIPDICQPILDRLATATEGLGRIAIVDPDGLTWIAQSQGARTGLIYQPDLIAQVPLHMTANGKAWLATLDRDEALARAVASGLGRSDIGGPRVITTKQTFSAALDETQERGWAVAIEDAEPGVAAVAATIRVGEQVVGTVSVAGPIHRFSPLVVPQVAEQVKSAAQELSDALAVPNCISPPPGTAGTSHSRLEKAQESISSVANCRSGKAAELTSSPLME